MFYIEAAGVVWMTTVVLSVVLCLVTVSLIIHLLGFHIFLSEKLVNNLTSELSLLLIILFSSTSRDDDLRLHHSTKIRTRSE